MVRIDTTQILTRIDAFKGHLKTTENFEMVQRFITSGECFLLDSESYFELKSLVASQFELHHSQVLITGSAKLGFSIAPTKRFRHFRDESHIDVAIIPQYFFNAVWKEVFDYWNNGGFWDKQYRFYSYLFRGWLRPDMVPVMNNSKFQDPWWEFFRELTNGGKFGQYKLSAGLYKSWDFLEEYQANAVNACRIPYEYWNENNGDEQKGRCVTNCYAGR